MQLLDFRIGLRDGGGTPLRRQHRNRRQSLRPRRVDMYHHRIRLRRSSDGRLASGDRKGRYRPRELSAEAGPVTGRGWGRQPSTRARSSVRTRPLAWRDEQPLGSRLVKAFGREPHGHVIVVSGFERIHLDLC